MPEKIVLIGAGSSNFGLGTVGDILGSKTFEGSHIVLHDINPKALERVHGITARHIQANHLPFTVSATTDRKEALPGATFAIISIEVGSRFDLWDQDWNVPTHYGIRQVYGENGGPGGLFHSLRIIPPILDICADIQKIAPQAFVFNFSNPMSRICTTVTRAFPDLRFTGLCHEIASLPEFLPKILETPLENIFYRAGGLNHFSVLTEVRYKDSGKDAYPDVRLKAPAFFEKLGEMEAQEIKEFSEKYMTPEMLQTFEDLAMKVPGPWPERDLFRIILKQFDYLPITSDSHFGEYVQWAHDVVDHQAILDFYRSYRAWCTSLLGNADKVQPSDGGWTIINLMEGIVNDDRHEEGAVNIPNNGFIPSLPGDIAVEVPAMIDRNGVHGVCLENYPKQISGLLHNQYAVHDLTAEAVLKKSKKAALQALLLDPVVHSYHAAEQTLEQMLLLQKKYLGYLQ